MPKEHVSDEWMNRWRQRLWREGQIENVPIQLRVSKDEAGERVGEAGPWEEFGARASSARKAAHYPSPAGWLGSPAPLGHSCQTLGHLRPMRLLQSFCHQGQAGDAPGMLSLSCLLLQPKSLVTVNITDAGPDTELPWVLAGQGWEMCIPWLGKQIRTGQVNIYDYIGNLDLKTIFPWPSFFLLCGIELLGKL